MPALHPLLRLEGSINRPVLAADPAFFLLPERVRRDAICDAGDEASAAGASDSWVTTMRLTFAQVMRAGVLGALGPAKVLIRKADPVRPTPPCPPAVIDDDPEDEIGGSDNPWG